MTVTTAQQMSFVAMIVAATEFVGFTTLWSGLSAPATRCRHRYYRIAAVSLSAAYLIAATRARLACRTLEVSGGWDGILAWSFYLTMLSVLSAQLLYMCVGELPKCNHRRERMVAAGGLFLGVIIGMTTLQALVLAVTDQLGWTNTVGYRLKFHGPTFFFEAVAACVIGAVPCAMKLLAHRGLDPVSRSWKKLQPMRQCMRTVAPECAFDLDHDDQLRRKSTLQLHQTVVEIRDAILLLRPYFPRLSPQKVDQFLDASAVPPDHRDSAIRALHLVHAVRAKAAGTTPELLDVAAAWHRARQPSTRRQQNC